MNVTEEKPVTCQGAPSPEADARNIKTKSPVSKLDANEPDHQKDENAVSFDDLFDTSKPKNGWGGLSSGLASVAKGTAVGVACLVGAPIMGAKERGAVGFAKGLATGVVGAVSMPVLGVGVGVTQIGRGLANSNEAARNAAKGMMWSTERREWYYYSIEKEIKKLSSNADVETMVERVEGEEAKPRSVKDAYYYDLLKLPTNASLRSIHRAYYSESTQYHPSNSAGDSSASERFCGLTRAYQTLSNCRNRELYDSYGPATNQSPIDVSDAEEFYAILFGSEELRSYVGDLNTVHDTDLMFKCIQLSDENFQSSSEDIQRRGELEKSRQPLRSARAALKLRDMVAPFADGRLNEQSFTVWCQGKAAQLVQQPMGSVFCKTIGYVLKMEATAFIGKHSSFLGLDGTIARIRKGGSELKRQFRVGRAVAQARHATQQAQEGESPGTSADQTRVATAEHARQVMTQIHGTLPKFLELALAHNLEGITSTLREANTKLFHDDADKHGLETRLRKAAAIRILGNELYELGRLSKITSIKSREAAKVSSNRSSNVPSSSHRDAGKEEPPLPPEQKESGVDTGDGKDEPEEAEETHSVQSDCETDSPAPPSCSVCSQPSVVSFGDDDRNLCQDCATGLLYECVVEAGVQSRAASDKAASEGTRTEATNEIADATSRSETPSDPEQVCSICYTDPALKEICCPGSSPHFFCQGCFNGHAKASFEAGGKYEKEQIGCDDGSTSCIGELPCPFFGTDGCNGSSMSSTILRRFLTDEVDLAWRDAIGRIAVARNEAEQERAAAAQAATEARRSAVDHLVGSIQEALSLGGRLECPNCHVHGDKDDACMHIECVQCSCDWCYCCGRHMDPPEGDYCESCGTISIFLESNPGYRRLGSANETGGYAALHEFHRRRMMYFLRQVKEGVPDALWTEVREGHGDMLNNVPTEGRSIDWDAISEAKIPLFGDTEEGGVKWKNDMKDRIVELQKRIAEAEERAIAALPRETEEQNDQKEDSDNESTAALDGTEPDGTESSSVEETDEMTMLVNDLFEQLQETEDPDQVEQLELMISEILGSG